MSEFTVLVHGAHDAVRTMLDTEGLDVSSKEVRDGMEDALVILFPELTRFCVADILATRLELDMELTFTGKEVSGALIGRHRCHPIRTRMAGAR